MSIISPLPYTIVNGSVIDADPVMADFNQIVTNVNSNAAAINGSTAQVFNVAPAVTNNEAVPYGQAQSEFAAILGSPVFQFAVANATYPQSAVPLAQAQADFAAINGSTAQVFNVANATTGTEAVAFGQLTAPAPNLLVNGSAEFGSLAWSLPTQAGYTTGLGGEGTYFTISSAVNGTYVATSADYAVAPGVALTLQAETFASGLTAGQLYMDLEFLDSTHTVIATQQAESTVSADQPWTFMSASTTTPANTAYWHARFFMLNATLTNGALRKIKVSGGTTPSPYSREADFPLLNSGPSPVAGLPAGITGQRAFAIDANAPTFLSAVAGGGAVVCPVFFNGSAWIVG